MMLGFLLVFMYFSFRSAFSAYLLWGWAGLIAISGYLYGDMATLPYAQIFAVITLATLLLRKSEKMLPFKANRTTSFMLLFVVHGFICAIFAYPDLPRNWELFGNVAKTVLFCALMPLLITSRFRIHVMVVMIALAVSIHGALDGLKFLSSAGSHNARGLNKYGDNNHYALVLVMVVPLLFYLFQYSANRLVRWGFGGTLFLVVLAVVATASRGGLVGLLTIATWVTLTSRRKLPGLFAIAVSVLIVLQFAPESWTKRMETISSASEDGSFMGRVTAWKVSSAIAVDNPLVGGGFRALQSFPVWDQFKNSPGLLGFVDTPKLARSGVAAHSIWFEVLGDLGFVGFFIFVALLVNAFATLRNVSVLVKRGGPSFQWASDLANLLGAVLLVYVVSGSLLSAAYFELPYLVMMLLEVIKQRVQSELVAHA
jgi:probable O-glycosylation ligase (exosortase A-associated)